MNILELLIKFLKEILIYYLLTIIKINISYKNMKLFDYINIV